MTLTYRSTVGRRLTVTEGDGNIATLASASGTVTGANPRLRATSDDASGSAGISLFHTGSREYLIKTDTGSGGILRIGHGLGDGNITTNWLVLNGQTTQLYFGATEALHISGTVSTEIVYRMQSDPINKVISQEWFRTVNDISNPTDYERLQLISDQVTASTFTLRSDAGGTGSTRNLEISHGSSQRMILTSSHTALGGIVKMGSADITNAVAGDFVLANDTELRAANAANTGSYHLIGMTSSDQVQLGHSGVDIKLMPSLVALGATSTAALGTIGGSGPTVTSQNSWLRLIDSTGAACWLPVWK